MEGDVCTNDRCLIQGEDWAAYRVRYYFLLESFFTLNIMGQKNIGTRTRINFMYISEQGQDYVIAEDESFKLSFGCQVSSGGYLDIIEESANGMISLSSAPSSFVNQQ